MAITNVGGPGDLTPGFNRVRHYFDSTNKNQPGFRYVVDLYVAGTATLVCSQRVAPSPVDGYGIVMLQKILAAHLSYDISMVDQTNAPNSWFKYDLKMGEEYVVGYSLATDANAYETAGNTTVLTFLATTFDIGDQVEVKGTDGGEMDGLFTVVGLDGPEGIVIDLPWNSDYMTPPLSGTIIFADRRKTTVPNLLTVTGTVFNGAARADRFPSFSGADYKVTATSTTKKLLTTMPESGYETSVLADAWLNVGNFYSTTPAYIYFTNDQGDVLRKAITCSASSAIRQVGVGPNNLGTLTVVSGTAPLIKPGTATYDLYVANSAGAEMSALYQFVLDQRCRIEDTVVVFLDRFGSLIPFHLPLRMEERGDVQREVYRKELGGLSGGKWTYDLTDGGEVTLAMTAGKRYTLTSNWLSEANSLMFEELVTSPFTAVKLNGVYQRCIVVDSDYEVERHKNKKLIRKRLTIRMSNPDNINS